MMKTIMKRESPLRYPQYAIMLLLTGVLLGSGCTSYRLAAKFDNGSDKPPFVTEETLYAGNPHLDPGDTVGHYSGSINGTLKSNTTRIALLEPIVAKRPSKQERKAARPSKSERKAQKPSKSERKATQLTKLERKAGLPSKEERKGTQSKEEQKADQPSKEDQKAAQPSKRARKADQCAKTRRSLGFQAKEEQKADRPSKQEQKDAAPSKSESKADKPSKEERKGGGASKEQRKTGRASLALTKRVAKADRKKPKYSNYVKLLGDKDPSAVMMELSVENRGTGKFSGDVMIYDQLPKALEFSALKAVTYKKPSKLRQFLVKIPIIQIIGFMLPEELGDKVPARCFRHSLDGQKLQVKLSNVVIPKQTRLAVEFEGQIGK